jgi:hypothetical protein
MLSMSDDGGNDMRRPKFTSRRCRMILHNIMEFANPIMKRKDPLTAAPAALDVKFHI